MGCNSLDRGFRRGFRGRGPHDVDHVFDYYQWYNRPFPQWTVPHGVLYPLSDVKEVRRRDHSSPTRLHHRLQEGASHVTLWKAAGALVREEGQGNARS